MKMHAEGITESNTSRLHISIYDTPRDITVEIAGRETSFGGLGTRQISTLVEEFLSKLKASLIPVPGAEWEISVEVAPKSMLGSSSWPTTGLPSDTSLGTPSGAKSEV